MLSGKFQHFLEDFWGPLLGLFLLFVLICRDVFSEQLLRIISASLDVSSSSLMR